MFKIDETVRGEAHAAKVRRDDAPLHPRDRVNRGIGSARLRLSEKDSSKIGPTVRDGGIRRNDGRVFGTVCRITDWYAFAVPIAFSLSRSTVFNHSTYYDAGGLLSFSGGAPKSQQGSQSRHAKHKSARFRRGVGNYAAIDEWRIDFDGFV